MGSKQDSYQNFFQALLKARSKNQMEEIKLKKWMRELDMVKKHNDRLMFNELFEQKREAYRLSYENKEVQKKQHQDDSEQRRDKSKAHRRGMSRVAEVDEDVTDVDEEAEEMGGRQEK